jgi:hypothetical protein
MHTELWRRNLKEKDYLVDLGVHRTILKWILKEHDVAQERNKRRALCKKASAP